MSKLEKEGIYRTSILSAIFLQTDLSDISTLSSSFVSYSSNANKNFFKSSKLALKEDPKQTNPYQIPGYSKILYFAYLFMKMKNLFAKYMYKTYGSKYNKKDFLKEIMKTDEKIAIREELGKKEAAEKRKEEIEERREAIKKDNPQKNTSKSSNKIGLVKSTKSVKSTSSVKTTGKITKK